MGIAKRLYLYAVSTISLLVLSIGLYNLVAVALGEIADALGATVIGGESSGREQLSLAIALVVVGAPVFAIHWWLVGRGWHGTDEAAADDRHSAIRAFHMGLAATVALSVAMYAAIQLLDRGFRAVLGVADGYGRAADEVAMILVAAPVWWFHMTRRNADLRHDRLLGAAAWLTRLHRYGWAFIGLMAFLIGASQVIGTLSSALIGRPDFGDGQDWWRGPLAWSLAAIVTGVGLWWLHVDDARRAIRDAPVIGEDDRSTALRTTYYGAVLLVALASAGLTIARSITELGRELIGVADEISVPAFLESVMGPVLVAVPFVLAGWLHWRAMRAEAAERGDAPRAAAERLGLHLTALVGIAFLTVGVARLGGLLLEQVLGPVGIDDFFRGELVWCVAQILVGAVLWLPAWSAILRRRTAAPVTERLATTSRAYLLLVVGAALIAGVPSAVLALFRLIDTLLGGSATALGSDLALPIVVVAVAAIVAAYHGRLVVSDLRLVPAAQPTAVAPATVAPTLEARAAVASPVILALVLRGQGGEDLEAVAASLREHLPPGVVLEGG
jgi:hypothetical protein